MLNRKNVVAVGSVIVMIILLFFVTQRFNILKIDRAVQLPKSVEAVLKTYQTGQVLSHHKIGTDFLLVEHQEESLANRFYLHDLKSDQREVLPTDAEFVSLEEIIDENQIILRASGRNSESSYTTFPYLMHLFRNSKAVAGEPAFRVQKEDCYFELNTHLSAGAKPICKLKAIKNGVTGLEFVFTPVVGQEATFYAGFTDIPPTDIRYDASQKTLVITFKGTVADEAIPLGAWVDDYRYGYIENITMDQFGEALVVQLTMKSDELLYLPSINRVGNFEGNADEVAVLGLVFKQK